MLCGGESKCSIHVHQRTKSDRLTPKAIFLKLKLLKRRRVKICGARHKRLSFTIQAEQSLSTSPLVYRSLLCTNKICTSVNSSRQVHKTPVKHFNNFLWHATQIRAFYAKQTMWLHLYLCLRNFDKNKKPNNCTFLGSEGKLVWRLLSPEFWGRVMVWCLVAARLSAQRQQWRLHYGDVGTDTSSRRLFLRLQDMLLPFFGLLWMNFTHTLSCLNCTRNLPHRKHGQRHKTSTAPKKYHLSQCDCSYSSEMSTLSFSRSAAVAPMRWSLVMISIRCSLLSKKSPLTAEAEPCSRRKSHIKIF